MILSENHSQLETRKSVLIKPQDKVKCKSVTVEKRDEWNNIYWGWIKKSLFFAGRFKTNFW